MDARHVRAGAGFGDTERTDLLARQGGTGITVDEVPRRWRRIGTNAALDDMRDGNAMGAQRREESSRSARAHDGFGHDRRVDDVAAGAADLFGKADPEQSGVGRQLVEFAWNLTGVFPVREVRRDLLLREGRDHLPQRLALGSVPIVHQISSLVRSRGMFTWRARIHSPNALACGSKRVDAATPSPSSPWITMLTANRLENGWISMSSGAASGSSCLTVSAVSSPSSQAYAASRCGWSAGIQTPTFASPPLSPLRAYAMFPKGLRTVSATSRSGVFSPSGADLRFSEPKPVSYTHLTLPTILRV